MVRCDDGNWIEIPVQEGFSQGCPLSPVLAAIVLNEILVEVDRTMKQTAAARLTIGCKLDEGCGGLSLIMGYIDDVNALVPLEDIPLFLQLLNNLASLLVLFLILTIHVSSLLPITPVLFLL